MLNTQGVHSNKVHRPFFSAKVLGYSAMILVLLIWSSFALSIRTIDSSSLTIADVALLRFIVPAILFAPWAITHFKVIKTIKVIDLAFILLGGIPFVYLAALGAKTVPTAYVATILAGTPGIFVAIITALFFAEIISKKRLLALSLILVGVVMMLLNERQSFSQQTLIGVGFLFAASACWAIFAVTLKRVNLKPITVVIILSYLSGFIMLILISSGMVESEIGRFSFQQALPFIVIQGLGIGVVATFCFSYAINQLGARNASLLGSISPAITAFLAVPIFGESLSLLIIGGIGVTIVGVILSNRC
ncbi:EamA/RhaT family transporter [Psychromonas sp. B3M02]|uniref:DMT family transporter n=1 Tax=Psychromonas sp. B3M02 TaxID=2267226 RepID=UPI000DEAD689|nr:DMT family transporter [Psychromonas sp. B3M02]RBW43193.1 EamA/RhaT family transporter [Psychromonas sp. B3M02]